MPYRRAVILYRPDAPDKRRQAMEYCQRQEYEIAGFVHADRWDDAVTMVANGEASVIVAPDRSHLDPHRVPRVEVVDEQDTGSSE